MSSIGPPTGMRDWLPQDALLRQHLMETIGRMYRLYGYLPIDTPVMEDLSVLLGKGGGENEKLLFKVLKRGEKLAQAKEQNKDIADYGLRFDLTVPLARFVATHQGKLPKVFRRYHIAPVWRADRPQQGRYREFYQCDIDVVGGATPDYEVEVITATERVLKELNLGKYRFRLSDKRLLPLLLSGLGASVDQLGSLTIALDKLDKHPDQVFEELRGLLAHDSDLAGKVHSFVMFAYDTWKHKTGRHERIEYFTKYWDMVTPSARRAELDAVLANLQSIMNSVLKVNPGSCIVFDPILVRGMDYYTGPVYEAVVEGYPSSILGGGRYDGLIGRFAGKPIPAVGCSIGFERILSILQERKSGQAAATVSRVLLVNDGQSRDLLQQRAEQLRNAGICIETYLEQDDPGKQFKYAEAACIKWAIESFDESTSTVTVRHLSERRDLTMSLPAFLTLLAGKAPA
ncbi:MAG: histidine--tRNA ligase [Nitrospirae bacterium]|nr:MAG: histidine--tRNA ligase [Nitrospirota bacterium]